MPDIDLKFDPDQLIKDCIAATKVALGANWKAAKELAKKSSKDLVNSAVMIQKMKIEGKITEEEAKQLIEEEKIVARIRLRSLVGIGLSGDEKAVNAIIGVLKGTANKAIGWEVF